MRGDFLWDERSRTSLWLVVVAGLAVFVLGAWDLTLERGTSAAVLCIFMAAVFVPRAALALRRRRPRR